MRLANVKICMFQVESVECTSENESSCNLLIIAYDYSLLELGELNYIFVYLRGVAPQQDGPPEVNQVAVWVIELRQLCEGFELPTWEP